MKTRYAITKINTYGLRVLAFANQGRNHFDTKAKAEAHLAAVLKNNSADTLRSVYGDTTKMRVDPVECYDHGDAVGTVVGKQKAYIAKFKGREVGAIGIFHQIQDVAFGDNEEEARLSLYDRFEHITGLTLKETK